jgi:hypothetical protein
MGPVLSLDDQATKLPIPNDIQPLTPEWTASLNVYWRAQPPDQARRILAQIEQACGESPPERSVCRLRDALRQLGLTELQIMRLVLSRHEALIRSGEPEAVRRIALEVLVTLNRCRGRIRRQRSRAV